MKAKLQKRYEKHQRTSPCYDRNFPESEYASVIYTLKLDWA